MSDKVGLDGDGNSGATPDGSPLQQLREWLAAAGETELNDPNACSLATVDPDGLPNVRVVLAKDIESDAVVFYTNHESAKGRELDFAGKAAIVFHWKSQRRQVRLRGSVSRVEEAVADRYYGSRPLESRYGAWASQQSRPLASREALLKEVDRVRDEYGDAPPRPPFWGGYRLTPLEVEFWEDGAFRLHDRFRWRRAMPGGQWEVVRLNP